MRFQRNIDMTAGATFRLTTIVAVSFLTIAAIPSVALAQTSIVGACVPDLRSRCTGAEGDASRACIKVHFKEFSLPCQLALVKLAAIKKACKGDVKKICADIVPGGGRIEACMKDHFADMSEGCKETISQAAGKS
jgi:cysteine rich repeat protein